MTDWRHAGHLMAACLAAQGVTRAYQVPGESFLALLDGLAETGARIVTARQEGGAAMMAEADAKLTGRPGLALVTRGPGATNAAAGVHVAMQDSTPLLLLIGQVPRGFAGREAFQEVDLVAAFRPLAKWAARIDDAARIPETVARACHVAQAGRPGPVVLELPEDMLSGPAAGTPRPPVALPSGEIAAADVDAILARLDAAERPLILAGPSRWDAAAAAALGALAEAQDVPVALAFRRQDRLPMTHPCWAGHLGIGPDPRLAARVRAADLMLVLGARLGEMTTSGYALPAPGEEGPDLIHLHPSPEEPGTAYAPVLTVTGDPARAVRQLAAAVPRRERGDWRAGAHAEALDWATPRPPAPGEGVSMTALMAALNDALPEDAILTNGAGNYAAWLHRHRRWGGVGTQLAPTSGSMGYGLPAAIAAKIARPGATVVCLAGDGCVQMTSQELATAAQEGAPILAVVCDNARYGTIRMHQEAAYPGRTVGTPLRNPDFAALARAHGFHAATVRTDAGIVAALAEALDAARAGTPALLHVHCDRAEVTPAKRMAP